MTRLLAVVVLALSACGGAPAAGGACEWKDADAAQACAPDGVGLLLCKGGRWLEDGACPAGTRCDGAQTSGPFCR